MQKESWNEVPNVFQFGINDLGSDQSLNKEVVSMKKRKMHQMVKEMLAYEMNEYPWIEIMCKERKNRIIGIQVCGHVVSFF